MTRHLSQGVPYQHSLRTFTITQIPKLYSFLGHTVVASSGLLYRTFYEYITKSLLNQSAAELNCITKQLQVLCRINDSYFIHV